VILFNGGKGKLQEMKEQVKQFFLKELKLELSEEKTLITHVFDGFEFLGYHVKRYKRVGSGKYITLTSVPDEKVRKFKQKIQKATSGKGAFFESAVYKLIALNSMINGFANYYKYTNWIGLGVTKELDWFINDRMYRWAKRKHGKLSSKQILAKYFHRQRGYKVNGRLIDRKNFGVKIEPSYVTDGETIWLALMRDKPKVTYLPKKKLNPFITYQYETEEQDDILQKWEGRSSQPYMNDKYWGNKKLALKRDKYKCRNCGTKVTVGVNEHCHHIDGDSSNHNLNNLATLCITCHYLTYGKEHELEF
jgi:hypothetical protein